MQKPTQRIKRNEEKEKYLPNKRIDKVSIN
jgi:hypothetical protein